MTSPDERASGRARADALELVERALREGRIVEADRDMRRAQLEQAQTMQDIDLQVRDLRARPATSLAPAVAAQPGQPGQPAPQVDYGPASFDAIDTDRIVATAAKSTRAIGWVVAIVVLLAIVVPVTGAVIALFSARDSLPDFGAVGPTDDTTYLPGQDPGEDGANTFTVEGYEALVDALDEESGSTYVFSAGIYPRYAVLDVPTGVNERYESYYWDGYTLEKSTSSGTSSEGQVDLGLIEAEQVIDLVTTVRDRVDEPESWSVYISNYEAFGVRLQASASNSFGESSTLAVSLTGEVIYDSDAAAS